MLSGRAAPCSTGHTHTHTTPHHPPTTHTHTHTHSSKSQVTKKVPRKRGTGLRRCVYTTFFLFFFFTLVFSCFFFIFLKDMRIAGREPPGGDPSQRSPGMSTLGKDKPEKVRKKFPRKCGPIQPRLIEAREKTSVRQTVWRLRIPSCREGAKQSLSCPQKIGSQSGDPCDTVALFC